MPVISGLFVMTPDRKVVCSNLTSFIKQIAVAYGLGIRLDLDYLILRFDGGMKAINPVETGKKRYPVIRPRFSRDFAFHFAVGYPF